MRGWSGRSPAGADAAPDREQGDRRQYRLGQRDGVPDCRQASTSTSPSCRCWPIASRCTRCASSRRTCISSAFRRPNNWTFTAPEETPRTLDVGSVVLDRATFTLADKVNAIDIAGNVEMLGSRRPTRTPFPTRCARRAARCSNGLARQRGPPPRQSYL